MLRVMFCARRVLSFSAHLLMYYIYNKPGDDSITHFLVGDSIQPRCFFKTSYLFTKFHWLGQPSEDKLSAIAWQGAKKTAVCCCFH